MKKIKTERVKDACGKYIIIKKNGKCVECQMEFWTSPYYKNKKYCSTCFDWLNMPRDPRKINHTLGNQVCSSCRKTHKENISPCGNPSCPPRSWHEH